MIEEDLKKTWDKVYFSEDCHEKEIIDELPKLLKDCNVFMDIGASGGQYTYFANKILQNKELVVVEADPIRYKIVNQSSKEWENQGTNTITTHHNAFYEKDGDVIEFLVTKSNVSGALFMNEHIKNHINNTDLIKEKVSTISLLSLLKPFSGKKIFAKIDVEGAEFAAFKGAYRELNNYDITFLIEIHGWKDSNSNLYPWQIFNFFNKAGFKPQFYKDHFIVRKSDSALSKNFSNFWFSCVYRLRYLISLIKK